LKKPSGYHRTVHFFKWQHEAKSMAKNKYDGIVEAVRLDESGQLISARMYEKKGFVFSDHFIIDRNHLLKRLKDGQQILVGKRLYKMGSEFETGQALNFVSQGSDEYIALGENRSGADNFAGIPHF
jgi:hypothetical protein